MDDINPIAQALIGQLWWHFDIKVKDGEIPLDSARMLNAFFSHSVYDVNELPKKYDQALSIARTLNHNYTWQVIHRKELRDETSSAVMPWKVWLRFERIEKPEDQE